MSHPAKSNANPVVPVPQDAGSVLLYGGVFDPPHLAHTELAAAARDAAMPEAWLVYVPASRSPLKSGGPVATDLDRVEMLQLATAAIPRTAIWRDEIHRAGDGEPSYWIDTIRRARLALHPDIKLRFLIGSDQAIQFHRWREHEAILALAEPLVMLRSPLETPEALLATMQGDGPWSGADLEHWRKWIVEVPLAAPSSTEVRDLLARGNQQEAARVLHPAVHEYIRRRGLYEAPSRSPAKPS